MFTDCKMRKAINADVKRMDERTAWLREAVEGLAKDVVELDEEQTNILDDIDNLISVMDQSANIHKNTIETLKTQQKEIVLLSESLEETNKVWCRIFGILIWLAILTWWVVYNVFF